MKILFPILSLVVMSFIGIQTPAFSESLNQRYFGKAMIKNQVRPAAILTQAIPSEPGSYYAVVMQYLRPFKEKKFVKKFLRPSEKNGYLQELLDWVTIVKLVPIAGSKNFFVFPVEVIEGQVVQGAVPLNGSLVNRGATWLGRDRVLLDFVLEGERVRVNGDRQRRFPLKSSWEALYSPGPYNPGYKQATIRVLELKNDFNQHKGYSTAVFSVNELKGKPVEIKGGLLMNHHGSGLFTFGRNPEVAEPVGFELVKNKIGVFVDIYDAKPVMNTVELILIDPSNSKESQMYFEEYGNKTSRSRKDSK